MSLFYKNKANENESQVECVHSTMILFINNTAALEMLAVGALLFNCNDVGGVRKKTAVVAST